MTTNDRYRQYLATAQYTWREEKVCPYHGPSRKKDRASGRAEKRAARQKDRAEINNELKPEALERRPL
jgi:glyoxylase-like metal-dependent hydrolase (beta-lactamase superfamily II)